MNIQSFFASLGPLRQTFVRAGMCLLAGTSLCAPGHAEVATSITATTGGGSLGTTVAPAGNVYNIAGGTRQGQNLFHGFDSFSVGRGDIANFQNIGGLPTANILSRVTGGQVSNIYGTIQTTEFPGANFFLMNPSGIMFGPHASLNVGGAVHFTTANYLRLGDPNGGNSGIFHADLGKASLLTSAPVVAFGFLTASPAPITVHAEALGVPAGQSITLVGGDITVTAGPKTGTPSRITAPGGQIQMASVASPGEVLASTLAYGPNLNGQSFTSLGTVTVSQGSTLDVSDSGFEATGAGGTVLIRGGRLVMDAGVVLADTYGDTPGAPVAIHIDMQESISLTNGSLLSASAYGSARAGDIQLQAGTVEFDGGSAVLAVTGDAPGSNTTITAETVRISGGSVLLTDTFGGGDGGQVSISASQSFSVSGAGSGIFTLSEASGNGGAVTIKAGSISLTDQALVQSQQVDQGQGGAISVTAVGNLDIAGGAGIVATGGGTGASGRITIAADSIKITGQSDPSNMSRVESFNSAGPAGDIVFTAKTLDVSNNARIRSESHAEPAGTISIATDTSLSISGGAAIQMTNTGESIFPGGAVDLASPSIVIDGGSISTLTVGKGDAGPVRIHADTMTITGGGQINSSTEQASGHGGTVQITATNQFLLSGEGVNTLGQPTPSRIFTATAAAGDAGSVTVSARSVEIAAGARIDSSALPSSTGRGGDVVIQGPGGSGTSADSILITGRGTAAQGSGLYAATAGTGSGGNISLGGTMVALQDGGTISAASTGGGNAGSVSIHTDGTLLMNGGTISTTAVQGIGGNISISAGEQVQLYDGSLISASSNGPNNAGNIAIAAGKTILLNNSTISTEAAQASGGNVTLTAPYLIQLTASTVSSSVQGGVSTVGGNIVVDPQFLILQNSQIKAEAFEGQGGNIFINSNVFIPDSNSIVSASSQLGVSGSVVIQSPISNLSQTVRPLPQSYASAAALLREHCAVRAERGGLSSLTVRGRDTAPPAPGGLQFSPLLPLRQSGAPLPSPTQAGSADHPPGGVAGIPDEMLRPMGPGGNAQIAPWRPRVPDLRLACSS